MKLVTHKRMKLLTTLITAIGILSMSTMAQEPDTARKPGRHKEKADELRKEHLTPRRSDTVIRSGPDGMPVYQPDTTRSDPSMPVQHPVPEQRMPVKELSDTLKQK
jgi:hypothetical protein